MTKPWPVFAVVVTILLTQWLVSVAMESGLNVSLAITGVVVAVMIGSALMSVFLFHETAPLMQWVGLAVAVAGVALANMAKS